MSEEGRENMQEKPPTHFVIQAELLGDVTKVLNELPAKTSGALLYGGVTREGKPIVGLLNLPAIQEPRPAPANGAVDEPRADGQTEAVSAN